MAVSSFNDCRGVVIISRSQSQIEKTEDGRKIRSKTVGVVCLPRHPRLLRMFVHHVTFSMQMYLHELVLLLVVGAACCYGGPFDDVNEAFNTSYLSAAKDLASKMIAEGPLFVFGDDLKMILNGETESRNVTPGLYTLLKETCHAVVTTYLLIEPYRDTEMNSSVLEILNGHLNRVQGCVAELKTTQWDYLFTGDQKARQMSMLSDTADFTARVVKNKMATSSELTQFCHSMTSRIEGNLYDAAVNQLDTMLDAVVKWKDGMTAEQWSKANAIVLTSKFARSKQSALQFFLAVFSTLRDGQRVYQMTLLDQVSEDAQHLTMGRSVLDVTLGSVFFNNPWSMYADIQGNSSTIIIDRMKKDGRLPLLDDSLLSSHHINISKFRVNQLWSMTGGCPYH